MGIEGFGKNQKHSIEKITGVNQILQLAIEQSEKIIIQPEDKNGNGDLLVFPEGPVSNLQNELHWKIVRTEAFKKWFGDWQNKPEASSKIVDINGEPLIVFHGSSKDFDSSKKAPLKSLVEVMGYGTYFTPYYSIAKQYGDTLNFCFLNVKRLDEFPSYSNPFKKYNKTVRELRETFETGKSIFYLFLPFLKGARFMKGENINIEKGTVTDLIENGKAENFVQISVSNPAQIMQIPTPVLSNRDNSKGSENPGYKDLI